MKLSGSDPKNDPEGVEMEYFYVIPRRICFFVGLGSENLLGGYFLKKVKSPPSKLNFLDIYAFLRGNPNLHALRCDVFMIKNRK